MSIRVGEVEGKQADPEMIQFELRVRYIRAYDVQPDEAFLAFLFGQVMEQEIPDRAFQSDVFEAIDRVVFANPPPGSEAADAPLARIGDLFPLTTVRGLGSEIYVQMYGVPASNENLERLLARVMDLEIPESSGESELRGILEDIILQLPPIDETGAGMPVENEAQAQEQQEEFDQVEDEVAAGEPEMQVEDDQGADGVLPMEQGAIAEETVVDEDGVIPVPAETRTFTAAQQKAPDAGGIPTWVWIAGGAAALFLAVRSGDRRD